MNKRIAAITMVRNDDFFLHKWVDYYGAQLGRENLYVYFDGEDQEIPSYCEGTCTEKLPKIGAASTLDVKSVCLRLVVGITIPFMP